MQANQQMFTWFVGLPGIFFPISPPVGGPVNIFVKEINVLKSKIVSEES
jgi:hypothetical protein